MHVHRDPGLHRPRQMHRDSSILLSGGSISVPGRDWRVSEGDELKHAQLRSATFSGTAYTQWTTGGTMSIVSARDMLFEATEGKYAVGAFNITSFVQMEAVVDVAVEKKAPVIIQTSVKPSKFFGRDVMVAIYKTMAASAPIPICLHLDHCT